MNREAGSCWTVVSEMAKMIHSPSAVLFPASRPINQFRDGREARGLGVQRRGKKKPRLGRETLRDERLVKSDVSTGHFPVAEPPCFTLNSFFLTDLASPKTPVLECVRQTKPHEVCAAFERKLAPASSDTSNTAVLIDSPSRHLVISLRLTSHHHLDFPDNSKSQISNLI